MIKSIKCFQVHWFNYLNCCYIKYKVSRLYFSIRIYSPNKYIGNVYWKDEWCMGSRTDQEQELHVVGFDVRSVMVKYSQDQLLIPSCSWCSMISLSCDSCNKNLFITVRRWIVNVTGIWSGKPKLDHIVYVGIYI